MTLPEIPIEATMPPGSVVITPAQMYAEMRTMGVKLDHLASVIDPALSTVREDVLLVRDDMAKEIALSKLIHDDHETRLRSIEKRIYVALGVATVTSAGLSQLIPLLTR